MSDDLSQGSLRGAGRNASGPLIATWQMVEWIRDQGRPVSRDEVLANCAGFVDPGYARRFYARQLNKQHHSQKRFASDVQHSPKTVDERKAQKSVLVKLLHNSSRSGHSLAFDRDLDTYTFVRMPNRTPAGLPEEQVTYRPEVQQRHVFEMELVIQLRRARTRGVFEQGKGTKSLNKAERSALFNWLSVFDILEGDSITIKGAELNAITVLRNMRARTSSASPKTTTDEKQALEQLWRALDNHAPATPTHTTDHVQ